MPRKTPKTVDIVIPAIRCVCIVCGKKLHENGKWSDLNICTTDGVAVLACTEHAPKGDVVVQAVQLYAKLPYSPLRLSISMDEIAGWLRNQRPDWTSDRLILEMRNEVERIEQEMEDKTF